ncbi:MAG: FtsX-like permease family protein [Gammaproteobacteria bacterium]|nr:FtsX-like permease family protein [Gammaproteobacteria bacterium]
MNLGILAWRSLINRRSTAILTIISIAISVSLLLGIEKIRVNARDSFTNTISGTDLIVGGRSGSIQLLLYSVFRMGQATNNIRWQSYEDIAALPGVKWTVPLSLGDSHRGFRVLGTNLDYFKFYRYGSKRSLEFSSGKPFNTPLEVVIGSQVARALNYQIGDELIVNHGLNNSDLNAHRDKLFRVAGILEPTATPVDQTVHVSLAGIEAMHLGWQNGVLIPGSNTSLKRARKAQLQPKEITAFLVGLENRMAAFKLQRSINEYSGDPLLAIFPGIALHELWQLMAVAENALLIISSLVVIASLIGMLTVSLAGLNERRREIAILRSVGAGHWHIIGLLISESTLLTGLGVISGTALVYLLLLILQPSIEQIYGLQIAITMPGNRELAMLSLVMIAGFLVSLIPAYRAYRNSLLDGLSTRI